MSDTDEFDEFGDFSAASASATHSAAAANIHDNDHTKLAYHSSDLLGADKANGIVDGEPDGLTPTPAASKDSNEDDDEGFGDFATAISATTSPVPTLTAQAGSEADSQPEPEAEPEPQVASDADTAVNGIEDEFGDFTDAPPAPAAADSTTTVVPSINATVDMPTDDADVSGAATKADEFGDFTDTASSTAPVTVISTSPSAALLVGDAAAGVSAAINHENDFGGFSDDSTATTTSTVSKPTDTDEPAMSTAAETDNTPTTGFAVTNTPSADLVLEDSFSDFSNADKPTTCQSKPADTVDVTASLPSRDTAADDATISANDVSNDSTAPQPTDPHISDTVRDTVAEPPALATATLPSESHSLQPPSVVDADDPFASLDRDTSISPLPDLGDAILLVPTSSSSRPSSTIPSTTDTNTDTSTSTDCAAKEPVLEFSSAANSAAVSPRHSVTSNESDELFHAIKNEGLSEESSAAPSIMASPENLTVASAASASGLAALYEEDFGDFSVAAASATVAIPVTHSSTASPAPELAMDDFEGDDFGDFSTASSSSPSPVPTLPGTVLQLQSLSVIEDGDDDYDEFSDVANPVTVTTMVSPGSTVHVDLKPTSATAVSDSRQPAPAAADGEDDWGDFSAVSATVAATATTPLPEVSQSSPSPSSTVVEDDDWSDFNTHADSQQTSASATPYHSHTNSASSPLPSFPSTNEKNVGLFAADFLDLRSEALKVNLTKKLSQLFSEEIAIVAHNDSGSGSGSLVLTGAQCVSCHKVTPLPGSSFTKSPPKLCLQCRQPISSHAQSALGPALLSLPRLKSSIAYQSLFVALGLPIPTLTPRLAKLFSPSVSAVTQDEDGLHTSAGDEAEHEHDDEESDEKPAPTVSKSSPSPAAASAKSPPQSQPPSQQQMKTVAVKSPPATAASPPSTPAVINVTPTAVSKSPTSAAAAAATVKPPPTLANPSGKPPVPAASPSSKASPTAATPTRPRTLEDIERMRKEAKEAQRAADKAAMDAELGNKKNLLTGKLSKLGSSISSSLAKSISPVHALKSKAAKSESLTPSVSSVKASGASTTATRTRTSSDGIGGTGDVDALAARITKLSRALPDLSWVRVPR